MTPIKNQAMIKPSLTPIEGEITMKGSISFEKNRNAFCVWWYVSHAKRSVPIRYYHGIKLYNKELADKLLHEIQSTHEKSKRGECVFNIDTFRKGFSVDVLELFEGFIKTKEKLKPGGIAIIRSHYKTWIKPFFISNQIGLHEINGEVIQKLKAYIESANKLSPKTVKNVMDTFKTFMRYVWRIDRIAGVPPFPSKSDYGIGQDVIPTITREMQFKIVTEIPIEHQSIFYWLILHPGRRPGEAMALQKTDYNPFKDSFLIKHNISDRQLVSFPKNGSAFETPCNQHFKPFIETLFKSNDSPFMFTNPLSKRDGKRYGDSALNRLWKVACDKCDVNISLYNGTKHSTLDHYYNVLGISLSDLMDLTGHKNLDCIKHYARMNITRKHILLAKENDAPYLKLIHGTSQEHHKTGIFSEKTG